MNKAEGNLIKKQNFMLKFRITLFIIVIFLNINNMKCIINSDSFNYFWAISHILTLLWNFFAPFMLYNFEIKFRFNFWEKLKNKSLKENDYEINKIKFNVDKLYNIVKIFIFIAWGIIVSVILYYNQSSLYNIGLQVSSVKILLFYIAVLFSVYITSLGFSAAFIMIFDIFQVNKKVEIKYDWVNEDGLGNFKFFFDYTFSTIISLLSGVAMFPLLLEFSTLNFNKRFSVYMIMIILSIFVFFTITYSLSIGNRMAALSKNNFLKKYRKKMLNLIEDYTNGKDDFYESIEKHYEVYKLIEEQSDKIPIIPFKKSILLKTIGATLTPLLPLIFEKIIGIFI